MAIEQTLTWSEAARSFHVMPADAVLRMARMERHQDVRDRVRWLTAEETPLALFFISHRWETLDHPDPTGRQLRAIQDFLRRLCVCIEAMMVDKESRLRLVPALSHEGTLQAEEVARRILGFGPFSDDGLLPLRGPARRELIKETFDRARQDSQAFQAWLAARLGVWLDYTCMLQKPLAPAEEQEFRQALMALGSLVASSTVLALRQAGDDYAARGWCVSEFFLASARSFSRGLFLDMERLARSEPVALPNPPGTDGSVPDAVARLMADSYQQDLSAFQADCESWSSSEGALVDATPPAPWASYRDLQGSSFHSAEQDPNPFRPVVELVRNIETALIEKWLMSDRPRTVDLGQDVGRFLERLGLRCSDPSDVVYLGFLLACHGWIDMFKPLFDDCLKRYVESRAMPEGREARDARLAVTLQPLDQEVRALFLTVEPHSAGTWHSRLSASSGRDARERAVIEQVLSLLRDKPPRYVFTSPAATGLRQDQVERLLV